MSTKFPSIIPRGHRGLAFLAVCGLLLLPALVAAEEADRSVSVARGAEQIGDPVTPFVFEGDLSRLPLAPQWQPGDPIKEVPRVRRQPAGVADQNPVGGRDPLLDRQAEALPEPPDLTFDDPVVNVAGQGFTGVNPPDTVGDVGQDHYIQAINGGGGTVFTIYDKADGSVVAGPITLDSLGSGNCTSGLGDPIVLFDRLADRWVLSEFSASGNRLCVYVSATSDPVTGGWFNYDFAAVNFPDYPKYGVWPDAYYVSSNENSPAAYAFDRENMLVGGTARPLQRFTAPALSGFGFQALNPSDLDGATAPPAGAPNYFMRHKDDEVHSGSNDPVNDFLEIFEFAVDWDTPANSTFAGPFQIAIADIDSSLCGLFSFSCFDQPGGGSDLDPLREVVMFRVQYRNFGSHETLVGNLVTDVDGTDHGGVRWFELRQSDGSGWSLFQEGTYAPDSADRWMGSAAMDADGNLAVGYNVIDDDAGVFAGLRYVGREAGDPLGVMTQGEVSLVEGSAINNSNRYGDYAALNIDPVDDCTYWFTGEYNPSGSWGTRIGSFRFDSCEQCQPQATADAGPDQVICQGESANVGTPALPDHSYLWSPGGETTAEINVSPLVTTTYSLEASTVCGMDTDAAIVFVDDGSNPGLDEDFEGDVSDWTLSGLWHQSDPTVTGCAPAAPSPVNAMYYGQDAGCTYDTGNASSGTLTSREVTGITADSTLDFDYYRVVESFDEPFDITSVEIVTNGGLSSTTVWSLDSTDPSTAAWLASGPISLADFAGEVLQVRFRFDTLDDAFNDFTGWLIDNVVVTGESSCTGGGDVPCGDVQNFQARCRANGTIQARVTLTNATHDGETVSIAVDGVPEELTVNVRRANFQLPNAGSGQHTISLEDPAACFPDIVVECP